MKIIKRSGVEVFFDSNKIVAAVQKANASVIDYEKLSDEQIQEIADNVEVACENMKRSASVEEIQDMVENQLMNQHAFTVARNYITYRYAGHLFLFCEKNGAQGIDAGIKRSVKNVPKNRKRFLGI